MSSFYRQFVDPGLFLQECDVKEHWVCGSNGRSYRNHCELHRDACITKTKIHAEHKGPCFGSFSPICAAKAFTQKFTRWPEQEVPPVCRMVNLLWIFFSCVSLNLQKNPPRRMRAPVRPSALFTNTELLCALFLRHLPSCIFCMCAVVCFLSDRDWLRERVIQWIQAEVDSDSVETSNMTAVSDLLNTYFEVAPVVTSTVVVNGKYTV